MVAVVEFHAFKDNDNRFLIKEFVIVSKYFQCQIIFKPPYSKDVLNAKMARTARWLTRHFHHIKWDEGDVPYDEMLIGRLLSPFDVVYTKGLEKAEFLRSFHGNVKELVDIKVNIDNISVNCLLSQHSTGKCALRNAKAYYSCMNDGL